MIGINAMISDWMISNATDARLRPQARRSRTMELGRRTCRRVSLCVSGSCKANQSERSPMSTASANAPHVCGKEGSEGGLILFLSCPMSC